MKVAVCISGQPRYLKECMPFVKQNLLNNVDVFFHCWWDESLIGTFYDSSQPHQIGSAGSYTEDVPELLKLFNPVKFEIEKPRVFEEVSKITSAPTAKSSSVCSMFYSKWKANSLKVQHEKDSGSVYDLVVSTRFDLFYETLIDFNQLMQYKDEYLILPAKWQDDRELFIPGLGDYTMNDCFAISSSPNMDIYSQVYPNLIEINSKINPPYGENYLGWNCKKMNNMKVKTSDFKLEIMHRMIKI
jgi:hypothetical protein